MLSNIIYCHCKIQYYWKLKLKEHVYLIAFLLFFRTYRSSLKVVSKDDKSVFKHEFERMRKEEYMNAMKSHKQV